MDLHTAVASGDLNKVKSLLRWWKRKDLNATDEEGSTPLHLAVEKGHLLIVELLIERGADTSKANSRGVTPLELARLAGSTDLVELLTGAPEIGPAGGNGKVPPPPEESDAPSQETPEQMGATAAPAEPASGVAADLNVFLDDEGSGVIEDSAGFLNDLLGEGNEPRTTEEGPEMDLHAQDGEPSPEEPSPKELAKESPEGIDEPVAGKKVEITLTLAEAAALGEMEQLRLLLETRPELDHRDRRGRVALVVAAREGHLTAVELLLAAGADVNAWDRNGRRSLHQASMKGRTDVVLHLLESGADVAATDRRGQNALHLAAREGHAAVVELLLATGADLAVGDKRGRMPMALARKSGHPDLAATIQRYEPAESPAAEDASSPPPEGDTPSASPPPGEPPEEPPMPQAADQVSQEAAPGAEAPPAAPAKPPRGRRAPVAKPGRKARPHRRRNTNPGLAAFRELIQMLGQESGVHDPESQDRMLRPRAPEDPKSILELAKEGGFQALVDFLGKDQHSQSRGLTRADDDTLDLGRSSQARSAPRRTARKKAPPVAPRPVVVPESPPEPAPAAAPLPEAPILDPEPPAALEREPERVEAVPPEVAVQEDPEMEPTKVLSLDEEGKPMEPTKILSVQEIEGEASPAPAPPPRRKLRTLREIEAELGEAVKAAQEDVAKEERISQEDSVEALEGKREPDSKSKRKLKTLQEIERRLKAEIQAQSQEEEPPAAEEEPPPAPPEKPRRRRLKTLAEVDARGGGQGRGRRKAR